MYTTKVWNRLNAMSPAERAVEHAKSADRQAIWCAIYALKQSDMWKRASNSEKKQMEIKKEEDLMHSHHETGRSLSRIAEEWGYGDQALAKEFDDSSPDWVTEDEDDPALLETRYRDDDMRNEGIDAMPSEEMVAFCKANGPKLIHAHGNMRPKLSKNFEWRHWCKTWLAATKIFLKKASKVDSNHCLAHVISPHDFFDDMDRAVWRTLVHSPLMCDENDWVSLPGPASWWDNGYDFKHHGWEVTESFVMIEARKAALAILKGREKPKGFEDMTWSTKELMILALA